MMFHPLVVYLYITSSVPQSMLVCDLPRTCISSSELSKFPLKFLIGMVILIKALKCSINWLIWRAFQREPWRVNILNYPWNFPFTQKSEHSQNTYFHLPYSRQPLWYWQTYLCMDSSSFFILDYQSIVILFMVVWTNPPSTNINIMLYNIVSVCK